MRSRHAPVSTSHMRMQCARSDIVTRSSVVAEHTMDVVLTFACPGIVFLTSSCVGVLDELLLFVSTCVRICCRRLWSVSRLIGVSGRPLGVICPGLSIIVSSSDSSLCSFILLRFILAKFLMMSASPLFWSLLPVVFSSLSVFRSRDRLRDLRRMVFGLAFVFIGVLWFVDAK